MIHQIGKVAVITGSPMIVDQVKAALDGLFEVDNHKNGVELHHALQKRVVYKAIISDEELSGADGITLHDVLVGNDYGKVPFMLLVDQLNNERRKLAMQANIAEIFSKPVSSDAIRLRVPYVIENFSNTVSAQTDVPRYKLPVMKRVFDIVFSGSALLMLSPVFLLVAILIRLESKGPIIYYSLRVGVGYNVFKFYKFRSMYINADSKLKELSHLNQYQNAKNEQAHTVVVVKHLCDLCEQAGTSCINPLYADDKVVCEALYRQRKGNIIDPVFIKIKNDPRVTKVGGFIRNMSIDELPQLWNVFKGDMSIVGNRPLPLYEAEKITTDKYSMRFIAPAGMTGLWQVEKRGRGKMSESERLNLDNNYAETHSFANDLRLILRTIPAIFQTENV